MPVSIGEWRVRIGRFIHRGREYDIRERKEKLLKERIRLLKLLEKRLLEKKEKSEGECESKQNDSSAKVENAPNESSIVNKDMPTDSHKEDSCSGSECTIKENTTQTESTTNHKSNGTVSTFPFFFTLLLPLFTLLLSLLFFFVFDFSNLLESCKPFLNWGRESTRRTTCLIIIIVCSSFAYTVFSYVIKDNDDLHDSLVVIKDEIAKAESTIKVKNTSTKTTVKSNNSPTESNINGNNTGSETTIKENSSPTKSTKECNNTPMNDTIKERNTPSIIKDEPPERKTSKTTTSNRKTIKEKNTTTKFTIREKSALPESKIRGTVAPKECHIYTLSTMTGKPPNKKTPKRKTLTSKRKMSKKKTAKEKKRATKTTSKANNSPTESNIKEDNMLSESTGKEKITQTKSTLKKDNTRITELTIKEINSSNESTIKENNTPTESTIKENNTPTECTIKENSTPSESTIKENNTPSKSTIKENNTPTESTIKENKTTNESTIKENKTTNESTIKENNTPIESIIKENNTPIKSTIKEKNTSTESTIKENNTPSESTIKENTTPSESTIKVNNTPTESSIKENSTPTESTIKKNNTPTESTIKLNNTPTESTIKENNTPTESTIIVKNTPTESTIKVNNTPTESIIKENNTPTESTINENNTPTESTIKENNTPTESSIKENNTTAKSSIKENSTSSDSTIKENNTRSESNIKQNNTTTKSTIEENNTPTESTIKENNTPTESTIKENNTPTESTVKENNTSSESTIKENNTPSESNFKDNNTPTESTIKENNTRTESTLKDNNTPTESTIKENNTPTESTIKENNTPSESNIKQNNTPSESTIKETNTPTESTIKENNTPSESNIKLNNTTTESTIEENNTSTESTIKENNTPSESNIKQNNTPTESTIKENNSLTDSTIKNNDRLSESTIKDYNSTIQSINEKNNTTAESANKGSNSTKESTIKDSNTPTESTHEENDTSTESTLKGISSTTSIKDNGSPTEYTNESNNHSSESPIKGNNSRSESTPKDSNTTSISAIKEKNTPSRTPTGERDNQPMMVNSVRAEYTIGPGTQKVSSDGKHSISNQIPSSLKGNTDDPVMQESTCLPEMILVKAGDVEQNPGPFDRTMDPLPYLQEVEMIHLSRDIPHTSYSELCVNLGYSHNRNQSILSTHLNDYNEALKEILIKWNTKQADTSRSRSILVRKLHDVELGGLGTKLSEGEYLPKQQDPHDQEMTSLQSSTVMAAHGGIADDLLSKLAEDIETGEQIEALGRTLGLRVADINRYTETNRIEGRVTYKGTREMLFDWRQTVKPCDQHLRLEQALIDSKLVMLADTHLKGTLSHGDIYSKKISSSLTVQQCREKLQNKYLNELCKIQMKPWDQNDYAEFKDMHTVVTMVTKDAHGKDIQKKEILQGSVAEIFSTKVNGKLPARILISAPAGRGKTTAVAQMAYDWVHRERGSALEHLPLLFVVKFRNTSQLTSIGEAIKSQLLSDVDDLTPEGLESFIRKNQGICHIILDGLDEYAGISSSNRSLMSNIVSVIRGEEFPECRVLVTTRPHLENFFNQAELPRVYTKMWIEGFSRENSRDYIDKFFALNSNPRYGQALKVYLDYQPLIDELVKTPLFCLMVCQLWSQGFLNTETATQTELLDRVNVFLMHYANFSRSKSNRKQITDENLGKIIRKLGKVALAGLLDDSKRLVFTPHDFRKDPTNLDMACELGIVSKTTVLTTRLPRSHNTTSTTIEFYHNLAQEHSAAKYLADQTDHSLLDKVLRKIIANVGDYENLIRFAAGARNNLCVRIMEALLASSFLNESERYRILLDCASETKGTEGKVSSLVQRCVAAQSIVLKSPTVYTVAGMKNLPEQMKHEVRTVKFEESTLTTDVTSGLWSCLQSFLMLHTLAISDSSLNFPHSTTELPFVTRLSAQRVTSHSYEGLLSSLPGLRDMDITIDDTERDIPQITAGLRRTGGQQLTHIILVAPPSLQSEKSCVSRETMRGLGILIREQNMNIQWLGLSGMKSLDGEDFVELVESSTELKASDSLRFKSTDDESFDYDRQSDDQCLYFTRYGHEKIPEGIARRTEEVLSKPADIQIQRAIDKGTAPWNRSRIMVIGPAGVGKTSLIRRLTGQKFDPNEESTKGAKQDIVTKSAVACSSWELLKHTQTANDEIIESIAMDPTFGSDTQCSTGEEENRSDLAITERKEVELQHDLETSVDSVSKVTGRSNSPGTKNVEIPHTLDTPSTSSQQQMTEENVTSTPEHRHIAESDVGHIEELTESERIQNTDSNGSTQGKGNVSEAAEDKSSVKVLPTIAKISQGITREEITKVKSSALGITYSMWDFGGQEIYYITHPLFLSWRSLYILVIPLHLELSDKAPREEGDQEHLEGSAVRTHRTILELIHFWLMSVYTHAVPDSNLDSTYEPKVLLIGTFAGKEGPVINEEKVTAKFQELKDRLGSNPYWKQVLSPMFGIDNQFSEDSEVNTIQDRIDGLIQDSEYMKVCKPTKWRTFLTEIEDSDQNSLAVTEARSKMTSLGIDDDKEADDVLKFYHDIGHLVYHQGCELIVLKPQFLNNIVSSIITVSDSDKSEGDLATCWGDLKKKGILNIELIQAVWKQQDKHHDQLDDIIDMMIKFDLICEIPDKPDGRRRFFVPCRSSPMLHEKERHEKDHTVEFTIDFHHFLPDGFLHRFYVRMAKWSMERNTSIKPTFHCREMVFYIDNDHRVVMTNKIHSKEGHQIKVVIYAVTPCGAPSERKPATVNLNKKIIDHLHKTLDDLKKRWARRIQYRVGIWCPWCATFGVKEWFHIRDILKAQDKTACCAEGCAVYVGQILKAFTKGTQLPSKKEGNSSIGSVHVDTGPSSSFTGNTFIGQQNISQLSRDERDKKTNRKGDSTDEDDRTRRDRHTMGHGSEDDSPDVRTREKKNKTNRETQCRCCALC